MKDAYNAQESEQKIQDKWFSSSIYHWDENDDAQHLYAIDTPPPTVSGLLHMGHVFSYCQADFIARYQRMKGKNVFYPIGFDDNGLPTERLVEKVKGIRGVKMARDGKLAEFIDICKEVVVDAELEFEKLFKSLGISYDWRQVYQTISDTSTKIAHLSFQDLYAKGLIYSHNGPVYWDVIDQTALAQSTIEDKEVQGIECEVIFKTKSGNDLVIMTTRPEMIPACVALLYNPNDERYKGIDLEATVPVVGHNIPVIADEEVRIDKGTGLVMCCTYGDWQDVVWTRKHKLKSNVIIQKNGTFNHELYFNDETQSYFKVSDARKKIVQLLSDSKALVSVKDAAHISKVGERSKEPIEIIESDQWYLKTLDFKEDLLEIIKHIDFHPSHMKNRLIQWIEGLNQDWCISRDRFFGIEIPMQNNSGKQIFDTWFTSGTSPQLSSLGINDKYYLDAHRHKRLFPMNLRPQAHEIIRTWTFGTVLKAYLHGLTKAELESRNGAIESGESVSQWLKGAFSAQDVKDRLIPWGNVMLSGWCLAKDGTKMSKSKGNVVTPVDLIKEKTSDIVRYWSASSSLGVDTAYNETKFADGKRLMNKLWNASKFCYSHFQNSQIVLDVNSTAIDDVNSKKITEVTDLWILSRLYEVINNVTQYMDEYEYSKAKDCVERFFWDDFCANYLEIIKTRVYGTDVESFKKCGYSEDNILKLQQSAAHTLNHVLKNVLLLLAPFVPHVIEEIYSSLYGVSPHERGGWPLTVNIAYSDDSIETCGYMCDVIESVRKLKSDMNLSMKTPIKSISLPKLDSNIKLDLLSVIGAIDAEVSMSDLKVEF